MPLPSRVAAEVWPPNYTAEFAARQTRLLGIRADPNMLAGAKAFYAVPTAERCIAFIEHWCVTYDPRNAGSKAVPTTMPFRLFLRQKDLVHFLIACLEDEEGGLIEKCRDMGATWVCCAVSVWLWLFWPGVSVGWGSRKEILVDKIGDPDSIFEKMRKIVSNLPREFLPEGLSRDRDMTFMKFINPETGSTITGEAGDNIGRGGRKRLYFKDESAHYERPELIEASLGDNTNVQIDISSVNGLGNVFHRRREAGVEWSPGVEMVSGKTRVLVMDWRDHPAKDQAWYDRRRQKAVDDGLLHKFAQEVDRDYASSVEGVIIPAEWVAAAVDAHVALGFDDTGPWGAALDVADGGMDSNALAKRKGPILKSAVEWGERDTGKTTGRAVEACKGHGEIQIQYDCIGVGAGVKAEANRLDDESELPPGMEFIPWNASLAALWPDQHVEPGDKESPLNKDFYTNLKAQGWWQLRRRFEKTYRAIHEGISYPPDELISLPSTLPNIHAIRRELSQATTVPGKPRLVVNKTPDGTKSPNLADAIVMAFWPCDAAPRVTMYLSKRRRPGGN